MIQKVNMVDLGILERLRGEALLFEYIGDNIIEIESFEMEIKNEYIIIKDSENNTYIKIELKKLIHIEDTGFGDILLQLQNENKEIEEIMISTI